MTFPISDWLPSQEPHIDRYKSTDDNQDDIEKNPTCFNLFIFVYCTLYLHLNDVKIWVDKGCIGSPVWADIYHSLLALLYMQQVSYSTILYFIILYACYNICLCTQAGSI